MALPTALLAKGLAGLGAIGGVVGGSLLIKELFKPKEPNEIIKDLGISGCELKEGQSKTQECELEEAKVKAINFTNKPTDPNTFQISGLDSSKKLKLVIEKGYQDSDFPKGLRFIFKNPETSGDVTIGSSSDPNKITLKANTSYDFKITSDGTKLEKAWTLKSLGEKVGLSCSDEAGNDACECDTNNTSKINVWKSESNYLTGATDTSGKKISVTKDTSNYKQGFKFEVKDTGDISLTGGTSHGTTIDKLTKNNTTYEIDIKEVDKTKKWFLIEKTTSS